jgi:hypothetical protein
VLLANDGVGVFFLHLFVQRHLLATVLSCVCVCV